MRATEGAVARRQRGSPGSPVAWAFRVERSDVKTSFEERVAARASCYAMALPHALSGKGNEPERFAVDARRVFDDEGLKITAVDLEVGSAVPGLGAGEFREMAEEAERLCRVSNALRKNVEIRLDARLDREAGSPAGTYRMAGVGEKFVLSACLPGDPIVYPEEA